jgi:hypothetical protein
MIAPISRCQGVGRVRQARQIHDAHLAERKTRERTGRRCGGDETKSGKGALEVGLVRCPVRRTEERQDASECALSEIAGGGDIEVE